MKKYYYLVSLSVICISALFSSCQSENLDENIIESIENKRNLKKESCTTIQDKTLVYSVRHYLAGDVLSTGFDGYGYNYQAHIFKGFYANLYLGEAGFPPYNGHDIYFENNPEALLDQWFMQYYFDFRNDEVNMTWNDTWLSNKDCNGDGMLDKEQNTIGSGAWENYHSKGSNMDENGKICFWEQHYKIIAVPIDSTFIDGYWFDINGNEIGENFYEKWAIIQRSFNSSCGSENGVQYHSPFRVGFGNR